MTKTVKAKKAKFNKERLLGKFLEWQSEVAETYDGKSPTVCVVSDGRVVATAPLASVKIVEFDDRIAKATKRLRNASDAFEHVRHYMQAIALQGALATSAEALVEGIDEVTDGADRLLSDLAVARHRLTGGRYKFDEMIFMGNGKESAARCQDVHERLKQAFSIVSGLQQGGGPAPGADEDEIRQIVRDIATALGQSDVLRPVKAKKD